MNGLPEPITGALLRAISASGSFFHRKCADCSFFVSSAPDDQSDAFLMVESQLQTIGNNLYQAKRRGENAVFSSSEASHIRLVTRRAVSGAEANPMCP